MNSYARPNDANQNLPLSIGRSLCGGAILLLLFSPVVFSEEVPIYSYLRTNMTPAKNAALVQVGLALVANGTRYIEGMTKENATALLKEWYGIETAVKNEIAKPPIKIPCQFNGAKEWTAYCQNSLMGFDCVCEKCTGAVLANWQKTRDEIVARLAELRCTGGST